MARPSLTLSRRTLAHLLAAAPMAFAAGRPIAAPYDAPGGLKSAAIVAAIRDGRLAAGDSFAGALGRIDPLFALSSLPFVATGPAEARRPLDAPRGLSPHR